MMSAELIQDGAVGLVALAAAAVMIRRVVRSMRSSTEPKCSNCASCETPADGQPGTDAGAVTHPLVVVRRPTR
jgi:hypothetical protein